MREDDVRIHSIDAGVDLLLDERNALFLFGCKESLWWCSGFLLVLALCSAPGRSTIAIVLTALLLFLLLLALRLRR